MMKVKVKFYKPEYDGHGGREYLYKTEMPLKIMDRVYAPSRGEEVRAIVTEINVVDDSYKGELKEIVRFYEE